MDVDLMGLVLKVFVVGVLTGFTLVLMFWLALR
jgi:type III secretory pathway component EscT